MRLILVRSGVEKGGPETRWEPDTPEYTERMTFLREQQKCDRSELRIRLLMTLLGDRTVAAEDGWYRLVSEGE